MFSLFLSSSSSFSAISETSSDSSPYLAFFFLPIYLCSCFSISSLSIYLLHTIQFSPRCLRSSSSLSASFSLLSFSFVCARLAAVSCSSSLFSSSLSSSIALSCIARSLVSCFSSFSLSLSLGVGSASRCSLRSLSSPSCLCSLSYLLSISFFSMSISSSLLLLCLSGGEGTSSFSCATLDHHRFLLVPYFSPGNGLLQALKCERPYR